MSNEYFNKAPDTSTTSSTAYQNTYSYNGCAHRLQCGYCTLLGRACPMQGNTVVEPTWRLPDITCCSAPKARYCNTELIG